ncbi:MAG: hypothetical protein WCB94_16240 [Terriglobales bacterium]
MAFPQLVYRSAPALPQGLTPAYFSALDGTAEEAAEKVEKGTQSLPQALKRDALSAAGCTTEVVPFPRTCANRRFSASCEAVFYPKLNRNLQIP